MSGEWIKVVKAAEFLGITRQAVYEAIRKRRLGFRYNHEGLIRVKVKSLIAYREHLFERFFSTIVNGTRVFKTHNGNLSPAMASKATQIQRTTLYKAIYSGRLPTERIGVAYVIKMKDLKAFAREFWGIKVENQLVG